MASDIYFDKVSLLLHFNGEDGSTTFTDVTGKTVTRINTISKISTEAHKFGGASLKVTQAGYTGANGVRVSHHSSIALSDKDFTIEFWMNPISISNQSQFLRKGNSSTLFRYLALLCNTDGSLRLVATYNASSWAIDVTSATGIVSINNWYHVAIVRNGSNWRVYLNGSFVIDTTSSGTVYDGTEELSIGCGIDNYSFVGYMDDFRITVGVARYTANFTPPTSEFPDGFGIISGNVSYFGVLDSLVACAYDAETHVLAGSASVSGGTYSITGLTAGKAYIVVCRPKTGGVWKANNTLYQVGDYSIPTTLPGEVPIFKVTSIPGGAVAARYWRMNSIVTSSNSLEIAEIQLHSGLGNENSNATITGTSPSNPPLSYVFDGLINNRAYWSSTSGLYFHWDFGSPKTITGILLGAWDTSSRHPTSFTIQRSDDNSAWTTVASPSGITYPGNGNYNSMISLAAVTSSGNVEPSWPSVVGDTVTDNSVVWTKMGTMPQPLVSGPIIAP